MTKPGKGSGYSTARWQKLRAAILNRDLFTCQICGVILRDGTTDDRAAVVDHIQPAKLRPDLFFSARNLWGVCRQCHDGVIRRAEDAHSGDAEAIRAAKEQLRLGSHRGWRV